MPMRRRLVTPRTPWRRSRQRLLRVSDALLDLVDRRAGATVFVLDVGADRPALPFEQLQNIADRSVARAPRHVVPLCLLSILDVQVGDAVVMLADVRDRIVVGRREVPDVEIDLEV